LFRTRKVSNAEYRPVGVERNAVYELYNIASDPSEVHNVISLYPEKAEELKKIMQEAHAPDPNWPLFN
jgi:arylsulfatase A-like enzyme